MDDDDLDDLTNEIAGDGSEPTPTWRLTIRRGRLTLTRWAPWMVTGGPLATLLPARARAGVTIADLTIHGADNDELSIRYLALAEPADEAQELLLDWAQRVGYTRVWLPDCTMVELEPDPEQLTRMGVRCEVCRSRWTDGTPEFWIGVREAKVFPTWCPICGCEMPQWSSQQPHRARHATGWAASDSRPRRRQEKT